MPLYRFECNACGVQDTVQMTFEEHDRSKLFDPVICECLGGQMMQVFGFNYARPMPEHYSDQLDTVVKSERHFNDILKRQAEEYTARTGMEVSYDTIDPTDPKAAGVTDAGMEATERAHHAEKSDGHKSVFS
jgi:hypothetical protein